MEEWRRSERGGGGGDLYKYIGEKMCEEVYF